MESGQIHGPWRPLGSLLCEQGAVRPDEIMEALVYQERTGARLGEILVAWDFVSRPLLTRLLAEQRGGCLEEETGFGSGLRAEIERRHRERSRPRLNGVAVVARTA